MKTRVREKDIEQKVIRYAKSRDCLIYKFSSPSHRGVCDRIIITGGGVVLFLELKAPNEKPTALQNKFLDEVINKGARAGWADSLESAKLLIDSAIEAGEQLIGEALLS